MTIASRFFERAMKLPPAPNRAVEVERDLRIPMPDGVQLLADRYVPGGAGRPPLVLVRSPYGRRGIWGVLFGRLLAERGFQVLIQSCRGTFGSGGTLDPFGPDEHDDGLATIAWLRQQPWYPGTFGTTGPSYLGMVQWAIAADAGPDLKAMAPQVTSADFRAPFYAGEAFYLETALGWVDQVARQEERFAFARQSRAERRLRPIMDQLPLRDLDRLATGRHVAYYQEWLAHNEPGDDYWKGRRFTDALDRVTAPVSMVSGWHDIFLPLQLRDYAALRRAGQEPYLTIGPWRHADQKAAATWVSDSVAWLSAHLLGDRSGLRPEPVRIFVTGAEEWRVLPGWPPATREQRWHLQPGGVLAPEPPAPGEPDRYSYDPADPTPNLAGPVGLQGKARVDNRVLEARADVLTYTSAPLPGDTEVFGEVTADLFVRSSREHADFFARLCEVHPTGASVNICDALLRLAPGRPAPGPDGTIRARFPLWPVGHRFRRGHRLRLQVSSGAHPRYARNHGSGEPLATATALYPADQQVYHDPDHPSAIILPVAADQQGEAPRE
jgi:putative CocE/NonD family hydrolase